MQIPLPAEELQLGVGPETGGEYLRMGLTVKEAVLGKTGLPPDGSVLDIGCGSGRMARHFVEHLRPPGRYVGMEIQRRFVDWCNGAIAPANPAFAFYHQDVFNGGYNPEGTVAASEYRFPFEDESFDAIILYSVFSHLLPEDAANYLQEIRRLLKPHGRCYSTWYTMTRDVDVRYLLPNAKEGQVGYGFPTCLGMIEASGLAVDEAILGRWNGANSEVWQDLLWLGRADDVPEPVRHRTAPEPASKAASGDETVLAGTLRSLDPTADSFVVAADDGTLSRVSFTQNTGVRVHGGSGELSALKPGQRVRVHLRGDAPVADRVAARGQVATEQVRGIVEAVDEEGKSLTLAVLNKGSITFRMDPEREAANVGGKKVRLKDLRPGQIAAVRVVPTVGSVVARDPAGG